MLIALISHWFNKDKCVSNIKLESGWIVCCKCKRQIGFVYLENDQWNVFVFPEFRRFKYQIEAWGNKNVVKEDKVIHKMKGNNDQ